MTKPTDQTSRPGVSRRQLLKATAGTAALLAAAKLNFPAGAFAQGAGPEVKGAKLGFIALSDAGPLFVAKDKAHPAITVAESPGPGLSRLNRRILANAISDEKHTTSSHSANKVLRDAILKVLGDTSR